MLNSGPSREAGGKWTTVHRALRRKDSLSRAEGAEFKRISRLVEASDPPGDQPVEYRGQPSRTILLRHIDIGPTPRVQRISPYCLQRPDGHSSVSPAVSCLAMRHPHAGFGKDVLRVARIISQLSAKSLHGGADCARSAGVIIAPDPLQQSVVGQDAPGSQGELDEQVVLDGVR